MWTSASTKIRSPSATPHLRGEVADVVRARAATGSCGGVCVGAWERRTVERSGVEWRGEERRGEEWSGVERRGGSRKEERGEW